MTGFSWPAEAMGSCWSCLYRDPIRDNHLTKFKVNCKITFKLNTFFVSDNHLFHSTTCTVCFHVPLYCNTLMGFYCISSSSSQVTNVDDEGNELGSGIMELTQTELILHTRKRDAIRWPYLCLRRYGYDSNLFSFESGRRCQTGQGKLLRRYTLSSTTYSFYLYGVRFDNEF